jgi:beta-lactamase class D
VIPWDGVERPIAAWNRDHNLASAFRVSAVWFYQELARRIGPQRMQAYLDTVGYGNRTMGGAIDMFWLDGGLRISPRQQVQFLRRLRSGTLPFSPRTQDLVRRIMILDQTPSYTLRAKTGRSGGAASDVGWFVGYLERGTNVYYFATVIDIRNPADARQRVDLTRTILRHQGLLAP